MSRDSLAKPYAKALYLAAEEAGVLPRIQQEFAQWITLLKEEPKAFLLLTHPHVEMEDKKEIIRSLMEGAHPHLLHFLYVMIDHGREKLFEKVYEAFLHLVDAKEGRIEAKIITAKPLDDPEIERIVGLFQEKTGYKLRYNVEVDPSLIGGVVVRIGDQRYDGSLATRLKKLEAHLVETRV